MTKEHAPKKVEAVKVEDNPVSTSGNGHHFLVIVGILVGLLVLAIAFGIYQQTTAVDDLIEDNYYKYGEFEFVKEGVLWKTNIQKYLMLNETHANVQEIPFFANYGPRDVENVTIDANLTRLVATKSNLILSFDPTLGQDLSLAGIEIGKVLVSFYDWDPSRIKIAINVNSSEIDFDYANCSSASPQTNVINFNLGNETSVIQAGNCYEVTAEKSSDIVRAADLIMYKLIGIIR